MRSTCSSSSLPVVVGSSSSSVQQSTSVSVEEILKEKAETLMIESQGKVSMEILDPILGSIEAQTTYKEPNRSPIYKGKWHVWYSNAPPPSNGQLGPFQGSAEQEIAPEGDSYKNILRLPPHSDDNEWFTVVLDGVWEDWDGQELKNSNDDLTATTTTTSDNSGTSPVSQSATSQDEEDWGAKFWKVTFLRLNFCFFGNQFLSKEFPAAVARVWRTTYLDDDTRIVRAGRTGRVDDEMVFYMKRVPRPLS